MYEYEIKSKGFQPQKGIHRSKESYMLRSAITKEILKPITVKHRFGLPKIYVFIIIIF